MQRRGLLTTVGTALLTALAGCGGGGGDETATPTPTPTATPAPTPTATPTPTPTATPTPTPTATPTPTPEPVSHAVGDRFVVDESGDRPFAYTVHRLLRADRILTDQAPEGQSYVVVEMTAENLSDRQTLVPVGDVWLRSPDVRRSGSVPVSNEAGVDSRIRVDSLAERPLFPAETLRGVLVFSQVPVGPSYELRFTPPGTTGPVSADPTRTHRVPVGRLESLSRLE
jgi:hypothetical protein